MPSLVGSEMCIRDSPHHFHVGQGSPPSGGTADGIQAKVFAYGLHQGAVLAGAGEHAHLERLLGQGPGVAGHRRAVVPLSLIHISEPTRLGMISYAVFCLKKKKTTNTTRRTTY